jgi:hypothetical protein
VTYVRALVESMFPSAVRCPVPDQRAQEQAG